MLIFTSSALLNVLKILIDSQILFLEILSMPTLISEMRYFRLIALLFMAVQFYHYLAIVKTFSMMGVNGLYSILGANYRVLCTKYGMNLNNIMKVRNERCANEEESIRKCEQVRELCEVRDRCGT